MYFHKHVNHQDFNYKNLELKNKTILQKIIEQVYLSKFPNYFLIIFNLLIKLFFLYTLKKCKKNIKTLFFTL